MTGFARDRETEPRRVAVALGRRSYDILIGRGLVERAGALLKPFFKRPYAVIVTDENVARHHLKRLEASLAGEGFRTQSVVLPAGERTKSLQELARLCDRLLELEVERLDVVVALGGGVIGDLVGFAAAILRRGVGFIQAPTSLLAQVDSSVGGKTGINSALGKNLIGAFHQPVAVLADLGVLETLPRRELAAGYAEIAKYGLLGDAGFFDWLERNRDAVLACKEAALGHAVEKSCEAKARIVAEDETETGVRALLNLGHTFGHALEAATGYGERLLHGEGVSLGMAMAFRFSHRLGLCTEADAERMASHLRDAGLPTDLAGIEGALPDARALLTIMRQDKKAQAGRLTFILVRGIGQAFIARDIAEQEVMAFLEGELRRR